MKPKACIILPTYNEAENVEFVISSVFEQAPNIPSHDLHVLVVDDNSPDGTQQIVRDLMDNRFQNLHLISGEKKGLGEAYKRGMRHAIDRLSPDLIVEMDADRQHDANLIPLFVVLANHGFSLVIGSRFAPGGKTPDFSMYRKTISLLGNWMVRLFGGVPGIQDCTSGYRCIKAELIPKCNFEFLSTRGYSFQSSFLCELLRNGARVIEVPIVFPDRLYGESKLSFKDQFEFLLNIAKIRFQRSEEFMKFCIVGLSGVVVNLGLYILLTRKIGIHLAIASPMAIELSILSNFFFSHFWNLNKRDASTSFVNKIAHFHWASGIAGTANYIVFLGAVYLLNFYDIFAALLGIGGGVLINYFVNALWTWRK